MEFEEGGHADTGTVVGELAAPAKATVGAAGDPRRYVPRARELGVDLTLVTPTAAGRRRIALDVQRAAASGGASVGASSIARGAPDDGRQYGARLARGRSTQRFMTKQT